MDGPDATRAIRALGYSQPVIGCTGNTLDMDVQRFTDSGCYRVFGKPFRLDLFQTAMAELQQKGRGKRQQLARGAGEGLGGL